MNTPNQNTPQIPGIPGATDPTPLPTGGEEEQRRFSGRNAAIAAGLAVAVAGGVTVETAFHPGTRIADQVVSVDNPYTGRESADLIGAPFEATTITRAQLKGLQSKEARATEVEASKNTQNEMLFMRGLNYLGSLDTESIDAAVKQGEQARVAEDLMGALDAVITATDDKVGYADTLLEDMVDVETREAIEKAGISVYVDSNPTTVTKGDPQLTIHEDEKGKFKEAEIVFASQEHNVPLRNPNEVPAAEAAVDGRTGPLDRAIERTERQQTEFLSFLQQQREKVAQVSIDYLFKKHPGLKTRYESEYEITDKPVNPVKDLPQEKLANVQGVLERMLHGEPQKPTDQKSDAKDKQMDESLRPTISGTEVPNGGQAPTGEDLIAEQPSPEAPGNPDYVPQKPTETK